MFNVWAILAAVGAYFQGSGNAGMTNTIRVMGIGAGITVFVIDVLKAFIAVRIGISFGGKYGAMVAFACVILGHCFPAAFGFKGGKGVASAFGAALALNWPSALIAILVAGVLFGITRRMSVASLVAALSYPVLIWHFAPDYLYFSIGAAAFLMLMHMANIKRIAKICPEPLWFGAFLRPVNETSKGANQHETGKDIGSVGS